MPTKLFCNPEDTGSHHPSTTGRGSKSCNGLGCSIQGKNVDVPSHFPHYPELQPRRNWQFEGLNPIGLQELLQAHQHYYADPHKAIAAMARDIMQPATKLKFRESKAL